MAYTIERNNGQTEVSIADITIGDLIVDLENLFPDGRWADFKLKVSCSCGKGDSKCCKRFEMTQKYTVPKYSNLTIK